MNCDGGGSSGGSSGSGGRGEYCRFLIPQALEPCLYAFWLEDTRFCKALLLLHVRCSVCPLPIEEGRFYMMILLGEESWR